MQNKIQKSAVLITFLMLAAHSYADDGDVAVVGPNGRSSVAIGLNNFHYNYDELLKSSFFQVGAVNASGSSMSFSGIYAIDDRISVSASVPWNFSGTLTQTWFGNTTDQDYKISSRSVGLAGILIDNRTDQGFKLVAGTGAEWVSSDYARFYGYIQPQYRFSSSLFITSALTVAHEDNASNNESINLNVVWSVSPHWSLVPAVVYQHIDESSVQTSQIIRNGSITGTYHVNRNWALSLDTGLARFGAITFKDYANENVNGKSYFVNAAVRSYFN